MVGLMPSHRQVRSLIALWAATLTCCASDGQLPGLYHDHPLCADHSLTFHCTANSQGAPAVVTCFQGKPSSYVADCATECAEPVTHCVSQPFGPVMRSLKVACGCRLCATGNDCKLGEVCVDDGAPSCRKPASGLFVVKTLAVAIPPAMADGTARDSQSDPDVQVDVLVNGKLWLKTPLAADGTFASWDLAAATSTTLHAEDKVGISIYEVDGAQRTLVESAWFRAGPLMWSGGVNGPLFDPVQPSQIDLQIARTATAVP